MLSIKFSRKALKDLKNLKKKFRKIEDDLEKFFLSLRQEKLIVVGDRVQNLRGFEIYKSRIKNSSSDAGSSGGFRLVYYLRRKSDEVLVLTIYSKTQKSDISHNEILEILKQEELL